MRDLLIEIGTEELPPSVIEPALGFIKDRLREILGREDIETFGTPRRLAFYVRSFENRREVREEIIIGPPWKVAFDEEGKPTKALEGFLKKQGASLEEVFKHSRGKGEYVAIRRVQEGKSCLDSLRDSFEDLLLSVPLPKRMRWTSSRKITFSRPVRWLLALYGDEVLDLRFGNLKAGRRTLGHRFLSKGWIELREASEYVRVLEENWVVPQIGKRRSMILESVKKMAESEGGRPEYPEGLVEEVANLVEYPFPVLGRFEEKFLELPDRVIIIVAAHHQRFFCVSKDGKLTNLFIGISNNEPRTDLIRRGYERVLRARLEDALFFYREDLKKRLEDLVPKLSGILIHPKIGTVLDKVERLKRLSDKLCDLLGCGEEQRKKALRAAQLSKADLLTEVVKEVDELQGYMGYIYASKQGEDGEVALALYEQYKPRGPEDELPRTFTGALLSLADKMDDLISFFSAGEIPRGSSDPYGLRRSAFGIFRILESRGWDVDLRDVFPIYERVENQEELERFLAQRLESHLEDYGYDLVRAVLAVHSPLRPLRVIERVKELGGLRNSKEFSDVCEAYRRVVKILPKGWESAEVKEELFREREEFALWEAVRGLEGREDVSLRELADLKKPIDDLFDKVLIMDKDESVRRNRLSLLRRVKLLFNRVADFKEVS